MTIHELLTIPSGGRRVLTVTTAAVLAMHPGDEEMIHVLFEGEDGLELAKRFPLPGWNDTDGYMELALACGLDESEAWPDAPAGLSSHRVEAEVFLDEKGRLDARDWSRVEEDGQ